MSLHHFEFYTDFEVFEQVHHDMKLKIQQEQARGVTAVTVGGAGAGGSFYKFAKLETLFFMLLVLIMLILCTW